MKPHKHLDAVLVALMLLAYVPGLAEEVLPEANAVACLLPAPDAAEENPAERL